MTFSKVNLTKSINSIEIIPGAILKRVRRNIDGIGSTYSISEHFAFSLDFFQEDYVPFKCDTSFKKEKTEKYQDTRHKLYGKTFF